MEKEIIELVFLIKNYAALILNTMVIVMRNALEEQNQIEVIKNVKVLIAHIIISHKIAV